MSKAKAKSLLPYITVFFFVFLLLQQRLHQRFHRQVTACDLQLYFTILSHFSIELSFVKALFISSTSIVCRDREIRAVFAVSSV